MIRSANKKLLCEPVTAAAAIQTQRVGKVTQISQFSELCATSVVYGNDEFPAGTKVWLRGDAPKGLSNMEASLGDRKMVIVPQDQVVLYELPADEEKSASVECAGSGSISPDYYALRAAGTTPAGATSMRCGVCKVNWMADGYGRLATHLANPVKAG